MNRKYMDIVDGVWPTMITPYTHDNKVDYKGLEELITWYKKKGVDGLFAVCQSSEMFFLSLEERVEIAGFVKEKAGRDFPVIASGHVSDSIEDQIKEIKAISATGIDAFVVVSNRFAGQNESDDIWRINAEKVLCAVPDIPFGIYECPYPYKRLISPELLKWCADTGRFFFLKDTCCNLEQLKAKVEAVRGSQLKIFNANSATLLDSMKFGISGFSGVMANFHPDIYVEITRQWKSNPEKTQILSDYAGFSSLAELQYYSMNAKYFLQLEGLNIGLHSRSKSLEAFTGDKRLQIEQFFRFNKLIENKYL
ncbi:MAG TPA: dihydrodipicolinate synthase family protein [Clostridiales bacterium]|nr:dihydrodipicolinate synthase family protein [Clostridiales bacterium]